MPQKAWHYANISVARRIGKPFKLMSKFLGYLFEVGVFVDDFVIAKGQDVYRLAIMYLT